MTGNLSLTNNVRENRKYGVNLPRVTVRSDVFLFLRRKWNRGLVFQCDQKHGGKLNVYFFSDRKWSQPRGRGSSVAETSSSPPGSNTSSRFLLAEKLAISQKLQKTSNTLLLKITAWQKRSAEFLSMSMILYVLRLTCFNFLCFSIYFRFCVIF